MADIDNSGEINVPEQIRISVVRDDMLFVRGFEAEIHRVSDGQVIVCASAISTSDLDAIIDLIGPDMVIVGMDSRRPFKEIMELIRSIDEDVKIAALSDSQDPRVVRDALILGASGYLWLQEPVERMISAIRCMTYGCTIAPSWATDHILTSLTTPHIPPGVTKDLAAVWCMLAEGYSNEEIAAKLFVTERTVKRKVTILFDVLGARNRAEAAGLAGKYGLLS